MTSFFQTFDEDKLLEHVLPRVFRSLTFWKRGMAADEPSLMNQVTSVFNTAKARNCDIGLDCDFHVKTDLFELHRRGRNQIDKYGSDLAITIYSDSNPVFTKTAFIQFKIGRSGMVRIERSQIESARIVPEVWKRSFVVAVDPARKLLRANSVEKFLLDSGQATISCRLREWEGFAQWLVNWLRCNRGAESNDPERRSIETLLRGLSIPDQEFDAQGGENDTVETWDMPAGYLPAKSWLLAIFKTKEGTDKDGKYKG